MDSYVCREMIRRCHKRGIQLSTIHDAYGFSPKYGNVVRQTYIDILAEIAESNLLEKILSDITGTQIELEKSSYELADLIRKSEYALS